MRLYDIIARASRSLRSARLRTILTSLAIAVGGFTLTLTLAASNGARQYTEKFIASNFDPSELIVGRDQEIENSGPPNSKPQEYDETIASISAGPNGNLQIKRITREDIDKLENYDFVEQVRENYQIPLQYVTREGQKKYTGTVEAYNPAQRPEVVTGELPASGDLQKGSVLLPDDYLALLGFATPEDALGREVTITVRKPFTQDLAAQLLAQSQAAAQAGTDPSSTQQLESLVETKTMTLKIGAVTKKAATSFSFGTQPLYIGSTDARELYEFTAKGTPDYDKFIYVFAKIKNGESQSSMDAAQQTLRGDGYFTQSVKDIQQSLLQIVNTLQIVVLVFGVITLIASIFGIVNTQYISVLERTREIGLMKALGMRRKDISRLFMFEASWIGFLGGVIGSLSALALGILLNPTISDAIGFEEGTYLLTFQPLQIVALVVSLMVIALLAGLLPAQKAARLDPIEALRTE